MNKNIILLIVGLLFLAGCASSNTPTTFSKPFIGGTNAISFDFIEGSPPAEVYDGGSYPFEVSLNVENKGEYSVPQDKVALKLSGFYPGDFNNPNITKNPDEDLDKSYIDSEGNIIPGAITYVTFPGFNFGDNLSANNDYKIRADLCYAYGTIAQADLCVLDDLTKTKDEVCKVTETKIVQSSSSPIQIENLEESIAGTDKITFSFNIVHRGSGLISKQDTSCSDETIDKDKVWVEIDTGLPALKCSGLSDGTDTTGFTTLYGGKRMIRCTQDTSTPEAGGKDFQKKVNIKATYDYKEHKEVTVTVKHTT
ncbi:MAG: hypothetical protein KKC75_01545 [Nanoarchaeota archaeon]|nr:hypothetical protein [Nanoarchaeota archaeon]MBU1004363.1 hypothetical protein [Nanoarchaeota archaeon]MBU1946750.1 hypothetical protein [Nanoarchaeota archaeon]